MKKYILIIAASAVMAFICASCSLLDGQINSRLQSYSEDMVKNYIVNPVLTLNEAEYKAKKDIFKEGYSVTKKGKYEIKLLSAADSTWSFTQAKGNDKYQVNGIIKMLPRDVIGLVQWSCKANVSYNEDNGYTSSMTTDKAATFYWVDELRETEYAYRMVFDGQFTVNTFFDGKALDKGVATFTATETGSVITSDWNLTTFREVEDE